MIAFTKGRHLSEVFGWKSVIVASPLNPGDDDDEEHVLYG